MIGNLCLAVLKKLSMHHIWSMMNTLNLIIFMLKSNVFKPAISEIFFIKINEFLILKSNITDDVIEKMQDLVSKV